jgi:hypothetical protein
MLFIPIDEAMHKFMYLVLMGFFSVPLWAQDVSQLLTLKPGIKLPPNMHLVGKNYKITLENKLIHSVLLNFSVPVSPDKYLPIKTNGFCLIQKPQGDVKLNRLYFFEMVNKRRYELNPLKKIKAILIQDMPGASEHSPCTFDSFNITQEET